jgi:hypothetical protein
MVISIHITAETSEFESVSERLLLNGNCNNSSNNNNERVKYPKGAGLLRLPSVRVLQAKCIRMSSLAQLRHRLECTPVHGCLMHMKIGTSRIERSTRSLPNCKFNKRRLTRRTVICPGGAGVTALSADPKGAKLLCLHVGGISIQHQS